MRTYKAAKMSKRPNRGSMLPWTPWSLLGQVDTNDQQTANAHFDGRIADGGLS